MFGLSNPMLGVFNIDIAKSYAETLFFLVDRLKAVLTEIEKDGSKSAAVAGLRRILRDSQNELVALMPYLNNDVFRSKAFKNSVVEGQSPDLGQSIARKSSLVYESQKVSSDPFGNDKFESKPVYRKPKYPLGSDGKESIFVESEIPDRNEYEELGYDTLKQRSKHYRLIVHKPLENSEFVMSSIFDSIPVTSGKQLKVDQSFWEKLLSKKSEHKSVGKYKGATIVYKRNIIESLENLGLRDELAKYDLPNDVKNWTSSALDRDIVNEVEVRVRLYLVKAFISKQMDLTSDPDVYVEVYLGSKLLFDTKDKRINDRKNPMFYSLFEFKAVFPGPSTLKVKFFDYDPIGRDEFIGMTEIDLEDRFFDRRWNSTPDHPIELRDIRRDELSESTGNVMLWVDIDRVSDSLAMQRPALNISPMPEMSFELRVIIWEVNDVPLLDMEGLSDVYVSCRMQGLSKLRLKRPRLEHRYPLEMPRIRRFVLPRLASTGGLSSR